jgi:hypothetical protein
MQPGRIAAVGRPPLQVIPDTRANSMDWFFLPIRATNVVQIETP